MADDLKEMLFDPRHVGWGDPPLPDWVRGFRPAQADAVRQVVEAFEGDAGVVVLSAPTGSGKTIVGELVRRALRSRLGTYVCTDRGLQDQVLKDFPYAKTLKGRANYPTLDEPERFETERLSADDCTLSDGRCRWCASPSDCPYRVAKAEASTADLAVLNTAYLLAEANSSQNAAFTGRGLVVADEADRLESSLMGHVSVAVGGKRLEAWGVAPVADNASPDVAEAWINEALQPAVDRAIEAATKADPRARELRTQRALRSLRRLRSDLAYVASLLPHGRWVTTRSGTGAVEFKPVWVDDTAQRYLWRHGSRWLLMSATVLDAEQMMVDLGQRDPWSWAHVEMPSVFPVENRPVYLMGAVDATYKNPHAGVELAEWVERVARERHPAERVLVHTVSFDLQRKMQHWFGDRGALPGRCVWYEGGAGQREAALRRYLDQPDAVLFGPGMDRGVDLPDDACRAVVIAKVPYPSLGDAQVAARLKGPGGQGWYRSQTCRSLVQMCGRGVRHERDRCATYVLDRQGDRVVAENRRILPRWWLDALRRDLA